jgi:hypothetical protein
MSDRSDDRPLTSDEMIKQARKELDRRPSLPDMGFDRAEIEERVDEAMPSPAELVKPPRPARREARRTRPLSMDRTPPTGFGTTNNPSSQRMLSIAIAAALLVMGIAVFLAVAVAGSTP